MERYLDKNASNYSKKTMQVLFFMYTLFLLVVLSFWLQMISELSAGRNLSGEYAPAGAPEFAAFLFLLTLTVILLYLLHRFRRETVCGDKAPRLAAFLAMSTREKVPVQTLSEILQVGPQQVIPLLKEMEKRDYIRNIEISKDGSEIRILEYHQIYVYEVRCKNCGAQYTQTSEDDYVCQYCGHPVTRV